MILIGKTDNLLLRHSEQRCFKSWDGFCESGEPHIWQHTAAICIRKKRIRTATQLTMTKQASAEAATVNATDANETRHHCDVGVSVW